MTSRHLPQRQLRQSRAAQHDRLWTTPPASRRDRCRQRILTLQSPQSVPPIPRFLLRHGFAIMGLASADFAASDGHAQSEGLVALVLWRLRDPAWRPSFRDLMEDARTCIDPSMEPATVLGALREALAADGGLAARATALAVEARETMARDIRAAKAPSGRRDAQPPPAAPPGTASRRCFWGPDVTGSAAPPRRGCGTAPAPAPASG